MSEKADSQLDREIDRATFQESSDGMERTEAELVHASDSGFSASWYLLDGQKVISYRGTDFPSSIWNASEVAEFVRDFGAGWLTSFNAVGPDGIDIGPLAEAHFQPYFAQQFF